MGLSFLKVSFALQVANFQAVHPYEGQAIQEQAETHAAGNDH